jgi:hypothetical protein
MGVGIYGLELSRSTRETRSAIYYRIHYSYETCARGTSIAGKHTVQLDVDAARGHFGGGGLSQPII